MDTIFKTVNAENIDMSVIEEAGHIIKAGGIVAFPTETVYGLGGDALNPGSSRKIYEAKGRPSDNPLIVHIADLSDIKKLVKHLPDRAEDLANRFWPGPLTMIFEKSDIVPKETTGGLDTVAIRFPSHPVAKAFIKAAGGFVAAPSANISGRPSPTSGEHVRADMDGRIDMIIDSGRCDIGLESTIIDMTGEPMLLRPGYVSHKMLEEALGNVKKDPAVFGNADENAVPRAPGMKYRHYAPKGIVTIVSGERTNVIDHIRSKISDNKSGELTGVIACSEDAACFAGADFVGDIGRYDNEAEIASRLYDLLRECDNRNINRIYTEEFNTPVLGMAIMNRLIKAAGHNIEKV